MVSVILEALIIIVSFFTLIFLRKKNRWLWLVIFFMMIWVITVFFTDGYVLWGFNERFTTYASRASFLTGAFMMPVLLGFLVKVPYSFLVENERYKKIANFVLYIVYSAYAVLGVASLSSGVIVGVELTERGISSINGSWYEPFLSVSFLMIFLLLVATIVQVRKSTNPIIKQRTQYMFMGLLGFISWSMFVSGFVPATFGIEIRVLAPLSMIFFLIPTYYAMSNYRFWKFRTLIAQFVSRLILLLVTYLLILLLQISAHEFQLYYLSWQMFLIDFGLALLLTPVLVRFSVIGETVFSQLTPSATDVLERIQSFLKNLSSELEIKKLTAKTITFYKDLYKIHVYGVVLVEDNLKDVKYASFSNNFDSNVKDRKSFTLNVINHWHDSGIEHPEPLVLSELQVSKDLDQPIPEVIEFMKANDLEVIFPLNRNVDVNGILLLGAKGDSSVYTKEDMDIFESTIGFVSAAFSRSVLYEKISDYNENLKREIAAATKDLATANRELQELDKMKDDLISIASHELRTPASIVKGKLHLLKTRLDKIRDCKGYDQKIDEDVEICLSAINREIEQVNTLLEASRVGKDTMQLSLEKYDLATIVKDAVNDFQEMAEERKLALELIETKDSLPLVMVDIKRIREVIDNLIANALKYTAKGTVNLRVYVNSEKNSLCVEIKDTGIGIPEKELKNLFSKFYRVQKGINLGSSLVKPGGTGLGLFVAKNIVEKHGGDIWVKSKEGVGSTFTFCIPIKQNKSK